MLNPRGAKSKVGDDNIIKSHSRTRGNKAQKNVTDNAKSTSNDNNKLTITTMPTNLLQHTEKKIKQKPTATTTKCHTLLTTKPKRHSKPRGYTMLVKTMVGINSPTKVKVKMLSTDIKK